MPSTDFHPDLRRLGRLLPKQVVTPRTYRLMRYPHRILGRRTPSHIEVVRLRPGVSVRLFVPALTSVPCPALLWIHSGGYVIGAAALDDNLCARFASELGAIVARSALTAT